jgi:hypothetical protein
MTRTKQKAMKQSAKQRSKQPVKPAKSWAKLPEHGDRYRDQDVDYTFIRVAGKIVGVETEIVELVHAVNAIPGVFTTGSYRGSKNIPGLVAFAGPSALAFFAAISMGIWPPARTSKSVRDQRSGQLPQGSFELGLNGMRWVPEYYPAVLAVVKRASTKVEETKIRMAAL